MLGSVLLMVVGCGRGAPNNVNPQVTEPPAKESDSGDNTPEAPFDQDATDEAADHVVVPPTLLAAAQTGVQAEIDNIAMYNLFLSQDLPDDVRSVFTRLRDASESQVHRPVALGTFGKRLSDLLHDGERIERT